MFYESKFNRAGIEEIIAVIKDVMETSTKLAITNNMDTGKIGLYCDTNQESLVYDLVYRYKYPARCAYKYDKAMAMAQLADELRTGRITMEQDGPLDTELDTLIYYRDGDDNILPEIDDASGGHPDAGDALLYAFRQFSWDCALGDIGGADAMPDQDYHAKYAGPPGPNNPHRGK